LTDTLQRSRRTRPPIHVESGSDAGAPEIGSSSAAGSASSSTSRCRRIAVVGCGHVGLVLAAGLVRLGHEVVGVDVAEALVADLNDGVLYLHEPGLSELLSDGLENGRLRFTTNYDAAIPEAELIFLAVDTPGWEAVIRHATYHHDTKLAIDESVMWGDYYFIEALDIASRLGSAAGPGSTVSPDRSA